MPIRKIPRNGRSITGRVASYRGGRPIGHESFLEHDCLLLLIFDPDVEDIEEQPVKIEYPAEPGARRAIRHHIPDFLVQFRRSSGKRPLLIEVKCHLQLRKDPEIILPKVRAGHDYAKARGWSYRVYTERRIRGNRARLTNIRFLLPYRRFRRDRAASQSLLQRLSELGRVPAAALLSACTAKDSLERARCTACLWRLLSTQEIAVDLNAPLTLAADVWLPLNASCPPTK